MKSYTQGRNTYGRWTKNTATANLSHGDEIANDAYRKICAVRDWPFLTQPRTLTTVAAQQFYNLPYDCDLVREINVVISTTTYTPKLSPSREHWDKLNLTAFSSDIPEWYFVYNGQLGLWPKPASSGNTINVSQKCRVIDLSVADYTTGTITTTSTVSAVTTVTGNGTSWTSQMAGRYIRITLLDTANTGDGLWYLIASVPSSTTMTLTRAYGGTALSAATAGYTIGQMPLLPETFQDTPWRYAAWDYWHKENNDDRAEEYKTSYNEDIANLQNAYGSPSTDMVIDNGDDANIINPNLVIRL